MRILILHGPNMNLIGVWSSKNNKKITLDKINQHIRKFVRNKNIEIKIMQTNDENKAVSYIQKNRNKFDGLVLSPGAWQFSGFVLKDLLELIKMPFITISYKNNEKIDLLNGISNINNDNIYNSFEDAITKLKNEL